MTETQGVPEPEHRPEWIGDEARVIHVPPERPVGEAFYRIAQQEENDQFLIYVPPEQAPPGQVPGHFIVAALPKPVGRSCPQCGGLGSIPDDTTV